jgi:hypothetical protein
VSYSISTLPTRNLHDVFGENDPTRRRAAIDEIFTEDCVFHEPNGVYHGRDEIDHVAGKIKATHPDFRYRVIARPRSWETAGGFDGYRAGLVRRPPTPGLISSLPALVGLPRFISSSTKCRKHSNENFDQNTRGTACLVPGFALGQAIAQALAERGARVLTLNSGRKQ